MHMHVKCTCMCNVASTMPYSGASDTSLSVLVCAFSLIFVFICFCIFVCFALNSYLVFISDYDHFVCK